MYIRLPLVRTVALLAWIGASANAAVLIETHTKDLRTGKESVTRSLIDGHKMSVVPDQGSEEASKIDMVFRGDRQVIWNINHQNHSYMEIDQEMLASVGQQVNEAMKQMQEHMADMPPAQRAMMEKMMQNMMPQQQAAASPKRELRKTDETRTIDGYPCVKFEAYSGDEKLQELWVTPWNKVGTSPETFDVFKDMTKFVDTVMAKAGENPILRNLQEVSMRDVSEVDGYPVLMVRFKDGQAMQETRLMPPETVSADPASFEIPDGYALKNPMVGGQ